MKKILFCSVLIFVFVIFWQSAGAMTAEEWFKRGTDLEKQNDSIGAIAAYKKAIDINSKYAQAYFRKGKVYFSLKPGNCVKALEDFNVVINLDSKSADAYYERGLVNAYMINNEQARSDMETASRLGHKGAQKWLGLEEKGGIKYIHLDNYLSSKNEPVVHFDFDSADIKPPYYSLLDELGMALKGSLPEVTIILAGHADSAGTEKYNHDLSLKRAKAVRKYLLKRQGIAPERIAMKAYGESEPVASNNSEKGRTLNRRVDMIGVRAE